MVEDAEALDELRTWKVTRRPGEAGGLGHPGGARRGTAWGQEGTTGRALRGVRFSHTQPVSHAVCMWTCRRVVFSPCGAGGSVQRLRLEHSVAAPSLSSAGAGVSGLLSRCASQALFSKVWIADWGYRTPARTFTSACKLIWVSCHSAPWGAFTSLHIL